MFPARALNESNPLAKIDKQLFLFQYIDNHFIFVYLYVCVKDYYFCCDNVVNAVIASCNHICSNSMIS